MGWTVGSIVGWTVGNGVGKFVLKGLGGGVDIGVGINVGSVDGFGLVEGVGDDVTTERKTSGIFFLNMLNLIQKTQTLSIGGMA